MSIVNILIIGILGITFGLVIVINLIEAAIGLKRIIQNKDKDTK